MCLHFRPATHASPPRLLESPSKRRLTTGRTSLLTGLSTLSKSNGKNSSSSPPWLWVISWPLTFPLSRDRFYELLREWQEKHLTPGWSMSEVQGPQITSLLGQNVPLANCLHFARLFQSQLVQVRTQFPELHSLQNDCFASSSSSRCAKEMWPFSQRMKETSPYWVTSNWQTLRNLRSRLNYCLTACLIDSVSWIYHSGP